LYQTLFRVKGFESPLPDFLNYYIGGKYMNTIGNVIDRGGVENIVDLIYPVGSIYLSVNNVNPSILFGGTWEAWGSGCVPVGVKTSDTDFNTVEKTGGAKTESYIPAGSNAAVTLTAAQSGVPAHSHGLNSHTHTIPALSGSTNTTGAHTHKTRAYYDIADTGTLTGSSPYWWTIYGQVNKESTSNGDHSHTVTTNASTTGQATGSTANNTAANATASHNHSFTGTAATINHLQPYITCYMWKRTA
jgi:hypothetical protein